MKLIFIIFFSISTLFANSFETLRMGGHDFTLLKSSYTLYGEKGEVIQLNTNEKNHDLSFVLRFTTSKEKGECSAKQNQVGVHEAIGNKLTLYTLWKHMPNAINAPIGAKIERFKVEDNASIT